MPRKIAVFTGSRAEYGLLTPVIRAIAAVPDLELQLIVSGDHLAGDAEAMAPAATVDITREDARPGSTPRAIGAGVLALTDVYERLAPDLVLIYGDRFEAFAALIAATQMSLPTAHLEGGDLTQGGTLDDVVRHAMSKLAHIHLPTNEEAADRLRAMGEEPWRIHCVGFPPIDLIRAGDFASRDEVVDALGLDPARPIVLFTQHPISTSPENAKTEIDQCLAALSRADAEFGAQLVLTHPNGDLGSEVIIAALDAFSAAHPKAVLRKSLGRRLYHGVLAFCGDTGVCVGNSSSGLKETGAFSCPNVDIGPRQTGRLRGANVIHVPVDENAIFDAIDRALNDGDFRAAVRAAKNPYGLGNTGPAIAQLFTGIDLDDPALLPKQTLL
ncbi:MAG: UDP-N-acetylglucosamine 2-epimerase [Silicimonas sp.]|nr:UDP-N-acetylglucosamine 2-epimerase [Silicimonas sp.]